MHEDDAGGDDDYEVMPAIQPAQRGAGFTVFSGPEEPPEPLSSAPPSAHLSDLFPTHTPPSGATPSVPAGSAAGAENRRPHTGHNAFTFSFAHSLFQPAASTPPGPPAMPAPEPPTSPSGCGCGSSAGAAPMLLVLSLLGGGARRRRRALQRRLRPGQLDLDRQGG